MSLEDTLKEMKAQLAEQEAKEQEELAEETTEETVVEEKAAEEPTKEEVKEEPKAEVKVEAEPVDDAGWARLRREKAAAEKRAEEAERRAEEALKAREVKEEDPTTQQIELPDEVKTLVEEARWTKAEREFEILQAKFRAKNPEYDDIAEQYGAALTAAIKVQNPRMNDHEVRDAAKKELFRKAGKYLNDGFDPIEELFHEAKELGFKPRAKKEETAAEEKAESKAEVKVDMKKLAENRKRSAGMAAAAGKEEGMLTKKAAAEMTVAEYSKLPVEERRRLMYS